ncbi:MAG: DUF3649 domain-containing protein [Rhodocyclaceae bacterium]
MTRKTSLGWRYRAAVASRTVAAVLGGYLVSALVAAGLARWLPLARSEATLVGSMTGFIVMLLAVMWVFRARSAWRAWAGMLLPAAVLALPWLPTWLGPHA